MLKFALWLFNCASSLSASTSSTMTWPFTSTTKHTKPHNSKVMSGNRIVELMMMRCDCRCWAQIEEIKKVTLSLRKKVAGNCRRNGNRFSEIGASSCPCMAIARKSRNWNSRLRDRRAKMSMQWLLGSNSRKSNKDLGNVSECLHATLTASGSLLSYNAPQLRHVEIRRSQLLHKTLIMGV